MCRIDLANRNDFRKFHTQRYLLELTVGTAGLQRSIAVQHPPPKKHTQRSGGGDGGRCLSLWPLGDSTGRSWRVTVKCPPLGDTLQLFTVLMSAECEPVIYFTIIICTVCSASSIWPFGGRQKNGSAELAILYNTATAARRPCQPQPQMPVWSIVTQLPWSATILVPCEAPTDTRDLVGPG